MTNSKNHAFLNCPANQTGAVGGTPPTRGVTGGQFKKETWVSAYEAALRGLPKAVSGDQALVHCLAFVERRTAPEIAAAAHRGNLKRLGVIPVVVLNRFPAAVIACSHGSGLGGFLCFGHEQVRPLNLDLPRDAALQPVVNYLHAPLGLVIAEQLRHLRGATKGFDK